ncbi:FAD/NAD(P)-binding oxidoreductase [Malaciobacter mytili]|uniref:NAD(P)/FAD-dependent oxidoreductase n=1 Tax=Malaciobacter mytili TaxID=603050 RepID=UPI003BB06F3F
MNDKLEKILDENLKNEGLSRREAIKLLGASSALFMINEEAQASAKKLDGKNVKILIVGGGLAGISTAARLNNGLDNAKITIIEPNLKSVSYQPGNTFIGAGLYKKEDVLFNTKDFLPKEVEFINDKAVAFDPDNNIVETINSGKFTYDYLIIATGVVLDFAKIKGLEELANYYTIQDSQSIIKLFKNSGASTVYNVQAAEITWENMQKCIENASKGIKQNAVFTHPDTAIKCGGAPKKMMYLMNARLNEVSKEARANVNMTFYPNGNKMFSVKEYEDAIIEQYKQRNMYWKYGHNLIEVDLKNKVATFNHHWQEKGAWDKDLEEYEVIKKSENVNVPYDFLHIAPPMKAPDEIGTSALGSAKGWVPVNKETLQHVKYKNVFSLGDVAAVPLGKTGGSVRKQYKVVADNIMALINNKPLEAKYDGYTVCPIITDIGKVMLAEFDWSMKPTPSFPLDPTQERYIWWLLKAYVLKPMTMYGMLSGRA